MNIDEKKKYILTDFKRKVVIPTGTMPDTLEYALKWWKRALKNSEAYLVRYESNSMNQYATDIWLKWIDENEETYRRLFNEHSHRK